MSSLDQIHFEDLMKNQVLLMLTLATSKSTSETASKALLDRINDLRPVYRFLDDSFDTAISIAPQLHPNVVPVTYPEKLQHDYPGIVYTKNGPDCSEIPITKAGPIHPLDLDNVTNTTTT